MTVSLLPADAGPRLPPHDIEIEQALLGAVIQDGAALDRIAPVPPEAFYEPLHQHLWRELVAAHAEGHRLGLFNLAMVRSIVRDAGIAMPVAHLSTDQYAARLAAAAVSIVDAPQYAKRVNDYAARRRIIEIGQALAAGAPAEPVRTLTSEAIDALDALASARDGGPAGFVSIGEAAHAAIERMQVLRAHPNRLLGVTWGLRSLDAKTSGLQRSDLVVIAGRPGMGKTGLAVSALRQSAEAGSNVLFFSLEMTSASLADRALADLCFNRDFPVRYFDIAGGRVDDATHARVIRARERLDHLPFAIEQQAGLTLSQIAARARKAKQKLERAGRTLDAVAIDHMHIIRSADRYKGNRVNEIGETSAGLKALAKELNCPVIALAQLSRAVETREDKRPALSDLRDSGAIEQDADLILFLFREAYYLERDSHDDPAREAARRARLIDVRCRLEAHIAKQRNGPIGMVELFFDPAANAARDLEWFR